MIKIATLIYPPGAWKTKIIDSDEDASSSIWSVRRTVSDWSYRAISALKSSGTLFLLQSYYADFDVSNLGQQQPIFGPESLPYLIAPLHVYIPPFDTLSTLTESEDAESSRLYITTDLEIMDEAAELLESLSLDVEEVRVALVQDAITITSANKRTEKHTQGYLTLLLNFVEHGSYPPYWSDELEAKVISSWQKRLDLCKSAIVKTVVEAIAEEKNHEVLWKHPGDEGSIISRLIRWLRIYPSLSPSEARDDLVICSTISLANLVRNGAIALIEFAIS